MISVQGWSQPSSLVRVIVVFSEHLSNLEPGKEAFTFDNGYCWISILVNIPATLFATGYYEMLLRDSLQKIHGGHAHHEHGEDGLVKHLSKVSAPENGIFNNVLKKRQTNYSSE